MKKFLLLITLLVSVFSFGQTATYTITSTSAATQGGTKPVGSSHTYSQTYTTEKQITSGKNAILTLSGYAGYKITSIVLEMKSNSNSGKGTLDVVAGLTSIFSIPNSTFSTAAWNGSYTANYTNITKTPTAYAITSGQNVVITIAATDNSLYIQSYTITYETAGNAVAFNANGGTGTMANQTANTTTNLTANTFTRTGYSFAGWNTVASGGGTSYANGASYPFATSVILYAQWTPNHTITFANLQFPPTGNILEGTSFDVYGEVYALGLTEAAGAGSGITAEIGYNLVNDDPSTWTNWQAATFNAQKGNNDEYKSTFSGLALGTHYYAIRFRYGTEPWIYGGYNSNLPTAGGIWNGSTNLSGQLNISSNVVDFANIQFPSNGTITEGADFIVYSKVFKSGFTETPGPNAAITAWIGISTTNATTPASFNSGWTWIPANHFEQVANDDVYVANIAGATRPAGIYYYVSRYKVTGSTEFRYGGRNNNFWTTGANSGVLTITKPTIVLTPTSLSGFNYTGAAGPSTQQTFTASGTDLTADVLLSAPANYEVSTTSGSGFGNAITLTPTSRVLASTTIYVRLKVGLASGTYNEVVTATSTSAANKTVNLNGSVIFSSPPNNALELKACIANNQLTIKWQASSGTLPTGYIVFAQTNATVPQMAAGTAGNASNFTANSNYTLAATYGTLGRAVYKGSGTSVTVTGLTNSAQYTFKVVAYASETGTGWANGINSSGSYNQSYSIKIPEVSNVAATVLPTSSTVSWNVVPASADCYEYMVVANVGAVTLTPTGDGSSYTANPMYSVANKVVYKGTGNSVIVTGLTEGTNYCYKVFVRELNSATQWSAGIGMCVTAGISYCGATSNNTGENGITNVSFNTIDNSSIATPSYSDFTTVATTLNKGASYNLSVRVKTYNATTSYIKAWMDWNRSGSFESGEEYDLGTAVNLTDGFSSNSPLNINVPTNAASGNIRMRIISKQDSNPSACGSFEYGEVEDYTINVIQPLNAEMNVKGGAISIANGFDAPYGLNNTLFAATPLNTDSVEKTYTIENLGIAPLSLSGVPLIKMEGLNPTDFIVTQQATTPVINGMPTTFKIKFNPSVAGTRTATVRIDNNDADENPYLFAIEGTGTCTVIPSVTMFPTSGPVNTLVSFTSSTSNLLGASVSYNNIALPIVSVTSNKVEVVIPANANDGSFTVQLATGCAKTQAFDVIDTQLASCDASASSVGNASGLIIFEVYDENGGAGGVVTLYNRTGVAVNLDGYSIKRAPTYGGTYITYANLSGTIAAGEVAVIGVSSSSFCIYPATGNGSFGSSGFNENDGFQLMNGAVLIDDVRAPNFKGYYLKRKNTYLNPNSLFDDLEWTTQSVGSGECLTGVGSQPILKLPPTITNNGQYVIDCAIKYTSLTVAGVEGFAGGMPLAYQWYVLGTSGTWSEISNGSLYSGAASATLTISDISGLDDYQYYCQIRESGINCYAATTASLLRIAKKTWNGTAWSGNGVAPTFEERVVIAGTYNSTSNGGDIKACTCEVTSTGVVHMDADATLNIKGALLNAGEVTILNGGSLVQHEDIALNSGTIKMERITKPMVKFDYTYWSSPVQGFTLGNVSTGTNPNRFYRWDEAVQNWVLSTTLAMQGGRGYTVQAPTAFTTVGQSFTANFIGKPNNGMISVPVAGASSGTNLWNLLGNPYPSAISADKFLDANSGAASGNNVIGGTLYFWTHNTPAGGPTLEFTPNDYAVYNDTGSTNTAASNSGVSNTAPLGYIAAGQGFFVKGAANSTAIFNNSMRLDGSGNSFSNSQFFRSPVAEEENTITNQKHRVWLNLKGQTQGFNQLLVGYVTNATNAYDNRFDGDSFGGNKVTFYSILEAKNLTIQGRALPFSNQDTVPLGYRSTQTGNLTISIDHVDGLMENQDIYLEDTVLNVVHDLKATNYTFATVAGTFNTRFVLRYVPQENLSNPSFDQQVKAVRIYKNNANLFVHSPYETIATVSVYDLMGRLLFERKDCNTNRFETNNISANQQTLIVKVTLVNGGVVTEKVL